MLRRCTGKHLRNHILIATKKIQVRTCNGQPTNTVNQPRSLRPAACCIWRLRSYQGNDTHDGMLHFKVCLGPKYTDQILVIIWFKLPSINVAANPAYPLKLAMAVAVVLCPGGNQIEANNAGPAKKTVPAIPLKIAPKFINLKKKWILNMD